MDFSFYFSEKYNFINEKRKKNFENRQNKYNKYQQNKNDPMSQETEQNKEQDSQSNVKTLRGQKNAFQKLSVMLEFFSKFIQDKLQKDPPQESFTSPKAFLYQMYFVIAKLDVTKLSNFDFLVNFGVTMECRGVSLDLMQNGGDYESVKKVLERMPFLQVLKICKYLNWADKKLHSVFYIENKDDISEDLLSDFKDSDDQEKIVKPKVLNKTQGVLNKQDQKNVIVKNEGLLSEHEYLFGKKSTKDPRTIDV